MLDLSDREGLRPLARLVAAVREAAGDTPILLVGATARDILLTHAHGIEAARVTADVDLALAVPDWESFLRVRQVLIASGNFAEDGPARKLKFAEQKVDLLPFGGVEDKRSS